jgi:hypothetical protein
MQSDVETSVSIRRSIDAYEEVDDGCKQAYDCDAIESIDENDRVVDENGRLVDEIERR